MAAEVRNKSYIEYEIPYTQQEAMAESKRCLQCTCEAIGYCDLRRQGIEYGTTLKTLEPTRTGVLSFRSVTENRFTGTNHDYIRDDSHAFILREPSRCIDCGRCANVCKEVVGAACYDFMRTGFDTLVTTPLDMSLNTTPCVSCGRCAETCPTGALMPKPRVLEKYEVDESRCILCGICVDACPYDALRCGPDFELAHESRAEPMIDLLAISAIDRDTEMSYVRTERDWLARAQAEGRDVPAGPPAADAAGRASAATATAPRRTATTRTGGGGTTATPTRSSRPPSRMEPAADRSRSSTGLGRPALPDPGRASCSARALIVVLGRNIVRSGLFMVLCVRGPRRHLRAAWARTLVAAAQVLIYIGAISVLILFAIMLTQTKAGPGAARLPPPGVGRGHRGGRAGRCCSSSPSSTRTWPLAVPRAHRAERHATWRCCSSRTTCFAFEVVSLLLLAAVIGGVFLAKREDATPIRRTRRRARDAVDAGQPRRRSA